MIETHRDGQPPRLSLLADVAPEGHRLPVPPLRLRRIRLHGVGPDGARFDPLDLNLTGRDGAASRVLLSLTNTGGKSTLITLVSSLVVPASRAQVGGKNLGDYVLTGDTSHIVCEWEDASTGTRTVTGAAMEWKDGRRQPSHKHRSTTNMHRAWYLFRTGPGLPGIDDLPFVMDGRRATFEAFLASVADLMSHHPRGQWVVTRIQQEWTRTLEERTSIDPVLFSYQMRMNDSEAGAEKLLATFDTPDNVVRFFVAALNDDREIADFTGRLGPYADLAAKRPELESLAGFGTQVAPLIELVAHRKTAVEEKTAAALKAKVAGGEHAAALRNRVTRDEAALADLEQAVTAAAHELAAARREYGQISDIRLQLQLEQARARLTSAVAALEEHARLAVEAELTASAWDAVDAVLDVEVARQERDAAEAAYDVAQAGLGPLRQRVTAAAAALAGRLEGLRTEAEAVADAADDETEAGREAHEQALKNEKAADQERTEARRQLADIDEKVRAAEETIGAAIEAGWLLAGERADRCLRRWQTAANAAGTVAGEEDGKAEAAEAAFDTMVTNLQALEDELADLSRAADRDRARLEGFDNDLARLAADDTVTALLGGPPAVAADIKRAADAAERAAGDADRRASTHERLAQAAREELAHLDETGTAPTGPDVLAVLQALLAERIGATAGIEWIERNVADPGVRPAFIAAHPDIAGGVIVTDARRFTDAVACLTARGPRTRTPITVTTAATLTNHAGGDEDSRPRHVVLPHRATWDRAWAAETRVELDATATREGEQAAQARQAAARYRTASASCGAFVTAWQSTRREVLAAAADESAGKVTGAEHQRAQLRAQRDQYRATASACRKRRDEAHAEQLRADQNARDTAALVNVTSEAEAAARRRPAVEAALAAANQRHAEAVAARSAANARITGALNTAAQARADRETWQRERDGLGVDQAAGDPGGNLTVVRKAWTTLRDELSAAEQGLVEAEFLNRAQRRLNEATARRGRYPQDVLHRATELATTTTAASSRESLAGAQQRTRADASAAEKNRLRAEHEHEQAQAAVDAAAPTATDRQNHIDLSNTPEWRPTTPADIPDLLVRLEIRNSELLTRRDAAEQAERDAQELRDAVAADLDTFRDTIAMWPVERMPTNRIYAGSKDAARAEMRTLVKAHRDADADERTARDDLRDGVTAVRAAATNAQWRDLDVPAAVRIRSLPDADLVSEAAVLARRVEAMTEAARGDLATMDTHRAILRDELVSLCREQRRLLREITRASRLPAGLGELSESPAIKIRFEDAPDDEAAGRLAERIDSWTAELAANPKRASSAEVRARWLADAVRDTVVDRARAGAWSIEILKPRIDGKVVYCPPDRIPHEFSGGQVLTLAVLVYCALSGVRSAHRPGGARPPGTLILDNPFGAASAEALIAMQHRLAAHTGLQLVCATGLHDAGVDAAFTGEGSVIVKLRNDGDLRRNLSFLRLRARVVDGLDVGATITAGRDPASPQNWVDATTYHVRR